MRIAVAATPDVAIPTLNWLIESDHELIRIYTTKPKPSGRGGRLVKSGVARWCYENSVECVEIADIEDFSSHIKSFATLDCVVVISFGLLLPQSLLDIPKFGFINLHFSVLPRWRGAAPVQRAIEHGDEYLGICVFSLDAGMDTGPIYASAKYKRDMQMRTAEALAFLADEGVGLVDQALSAIAASINPVPQVDFGACIARKIKKDETVIDWEMSAERIHQKILAFYPNPVARTVFRSEVLKITMANLSTKVEVELAPGALLVTKTGLFIGANNGILEILSLIPQGKSEMSGADWARGVRVEDGERCG